MDSPQSGASVGSDGPEGRQKKRVRIWTAEDRAKHRVLERERREAFSDNLLASQMCCRHFTSLIR